MTLTQRKQQWMQLRLSTSPRSKFPSVKIRWKISRLIVFLYQDGIIPLIIFQRAKLSTRGFTHLCWRNWRIFWRKATREGHQDGVVLARKCRGFTGTWNPEETGLPGLPVSWSPTLLSGSSTVTLRPVPWTEKTIAVLPFFIPFGDHCCRRDLFGRTIFWIFLSGLQKWEQRSNKFIQLRWGYVK